jgi:xylose isomerase
MRSYLILKEKAQKFNADPEIQAILQHLNAGDAHIDPLLTGGYSKEAAQQIKHLPLDASELAKRSIPYEKLDQLVFDLLTGVR